MAQPQMTRELSGLGIGLTNVDINSGYTTHSQLRNISQIPDAAGENNILSTPATNNIHEDKAATSSNLYWPARDT